MTNIKSIVVGNHYYTVGNLYPAADAIVLIGKITAIGVKPLDSVPPGTAITITVETGSGPVQQDIITLEPWTAWL